MSSKANSQTKQNKVGETKLKSAFRSEIELIHKILVPDKQKSID